MKKMIIFGAGSLAILAYIHFTNEGLYEVCAFTVNEKYLDQKKIFELDVVPYEDIEKTHPPDLYSMFVAIGYRKGNKAKAKVYNDAKAKGYELVSCISAKYNQLVHVKVGDNCLIMPNAIIQPFAEIGNDVVIWSGSFIGHHSRIGDHCFIAPEAAIAGEVEIGQYCFVGINATIKNGLTIAPECVIGAGAVILKDTERGKVYPGQQATVLPVPIDELRDFR